MRLNTTFKIREGLSIEWVTKNTVLGQGEPGLSVDTGEFKIGDGVTGWNQLDGFLSKEAMLAAMALLVADAVADSDPSNGAALTIHIADPTPHPIYDDGPSLALLYQNAKV